MSRLTAHERAVGIESRGSRRPFALPGSVEHFVPDHPFRVLHTRLDLRVDVRGKRIQGTASHRLRAQGGPLGEISLHAAELEIAEIRIASLPCGFTHRGHTLSIRPTEMIADGAEVLVEIDYSGSPALGMYFISPDEARPQRPWQAWTQGQDEDSHYWFPCFDDPSMKQTTEVRAEVEEEFIALSNGALLERVPTEEGWHRFHYRFDVPHPAYLVALVVGTFDVLEDRVGQTELRFYHSPGRQQEARNAFTRTADMVHFFEETLGVPYPYTHYHQVVVEDFVFGGMENTTLTLLYDPTLHDDRAHLDYRSEPLVSHELAHQWFGDLLTCRSWAHAWLNESWATYMECLYQGRAFGEDEFRYYLYETFSTWMDESAHRYQRPLVQRRYRQPIEVFDRTLYEKGACILHMLRLDLGNSPFFRGVRLYLERHRGGAVETEDFRRAMEEATGRSLERFFQEWVYREGHPHLRASWEFDTATRWLKVSLEHLHHDGAELSHHARHTIRVFTAAAHTDHVIPLSEIKQVIWIRCEDEPLAIALGSGGWVVAEYEVDQPAGAWAHVLEKDPDVMGRLRALAALGKLPERIALEALKTALFQDSFWGVRARAADTLSRASGEKGRDALLHALQTAESSRVRRAAARSLGKWREDPAVQASLQGHLHHGDPSAYVEAELADSVGKVGGEAALPLLVAALKRPSHVDCIVRGALSGLAALKDPRALPWLKEHSSKGHSVWARMSAIQAAGRLGPLLLEKVEREGLRLHLQDLLCEPDFFVQRASLTALQTLGDPAALPAVDAARSLRDGRLSAQAEEVSASLRSAGTVPESIDRLRLDLNALQEENRKLRERIEDVAARGAAGT